MVAMLLRTDFDHAKSRAHLFGGCSTFAKKVVLTRRIKWIEDSSGSQSLLVHLGLPPEGATCIALWAISPCTAFLLRYRCHLDSLLRNRMEPETFWKFLRRCGQGLFSTHARTPGYAGLRVIQAPRFPGACAFKANQTKSLNNINRLQSIFIPCSRKLEQ
jgi:hypothetical protein